MRKILFRGKRTDNGEWVEGYITRRPSPIQYGRHYSPWFIDKPPSDPDDSSGFYNVDGETVGQFIGRTDKNGIKIFEHDIVKYQNDIFEVCYNEPHMMFYIFGLHGRGGVNGFTMTNTSSLEVVGNIFDNTELRRKKSEEAKQ